MSATVDWRRAARRLGGVAAVRTLRAWRQLRWVLGAPATRLPDHLVNGLSVGAGLVVVGGGVSLLAGVPAAMAAAAGAAAVSVADTVVPRQAKAAQMLPAWASSSLVALLVQLASPHPWALAGVVLAVTFASVLWQAWGKRGGPQSFVMIMSLVFQMAAHAGWLGDAAGWSRFGWAVAGGGLFVLWALGSARLLQRRYRRLAVVEAVEAVAELLHAQSGWAGALAALAGCDEEAPGAGGTGRGLRARHWTGGWPIRGPGSDGAGWLRWPDWSPTLPWPSRGADPAVRADEALLAIVRCQAAMAEPLQQARDLVYSVGGNGPVPRLAAVLVRVIDMRDQALACQLDLELLPRSPVGCAALPHAQRLLDGLAEDLIELAAALRDGTPLPPARSVERELLAMLSTAEAAALRELHAGELSGMLASRVGRWPAGPRATSSSTFSSPALPGAAPHHASALGQMADPAASSGPAAHPAAAPGEPLHPAAALALVRGLASRARHVARARQRVAAAWRAAPGEAQVPGVDRAALRGFVSPVGWQLATLRGHLRWSSPVLRHALRATLAMGCAYAVARLLPWGEHQHWLLLTVAAVMRGNLEQTLMRRNARVIGTVLGCMAAFLLLEFTSAPAAVFAVMVLALSLAHAYVLVDYRVTAAAGALMALLQIHLLSRYTGGLGAGVVVERVIDTVLGAGIAWAFSYVLPSWEREQLPRLVRRLLRAQADYARQVLVWQPQPAAERAWRSARREVYDVLWLLTQTLQRMAHEPQAVRDALHGLETLLVRSYRLITLLAAVRTLLTVRGAELDALQAQSALAEAVRVLEQELGQEPAAAGAAAVTGDRSAGPGAPQPAQEAAVAGTAPVIALDELPRAGTDDPTPWLQRRLHLARQEAVQLAAGAQVLLRELAAAPPPTASR